MAFQAVRRIRLGTEWFESGDTIPESLERNWALLRRRGLVVEINPGGGHQGQRGPDDGSREHLDSLPRRELNKRAEDAGVEHPDRLPNKAAVIDALLAAGS